jgi:hypothetical protein
MFFLAGDIFIRRNILAGTLHYSRHDDVYEELAPLFFKYDQKKRHSHSPPLSFCWGDTPHAMDPDSPTSHPRHQRMCNVASASSPSPRHAWMSPSKTHRKMVDFTHKFHGIFNNQSNKNQIFEWILKIHNIGR